MKNMNAEKMMSSVLNELGISRNVVRNLSIVREDGYYHVTYATDWMEYEVYADAETAEIVGLDTNPVPEEILVSETAGRARAA